LTEKSILKKFAVHIEEIHPNWRVQTEIPCGKLVADGRIIEVDNDGIVKGIVCYFEAKDEKSDIKELVATAFGQAQYYAERTGCEAWLVLSHESVERFLASGKKLDPRVKLFDIDKRTLIDMEAINEKMSKSRMKRAMERTYFKEWTKTFTIETTSPIGLTNPEYDGDMVIFNLGQRVRGMLKEIMKTESPTLAEQIKYSLTVEPANVILCKKDELSMTTDYITDKKDSCIKRVIYNVCPPKKLTFTISCLEKTGRLTPEILTHALIKAGKYCGIGDSHSDGVHGRFRLVDGL
jgi:hypothetical protein